MLVTMQKTIKVVDTNDYMRALNKIQETMTVTNIQFVAVDDENKFFQFTIHGYGEALGTYLPY